MVLQLVPLNTEWLDGYRTALDRIRDLQRKFTPAMTLGELAIVDILLTEAGRSCPLLHADVEGAGRDD